MTRVFVDTNVLFPFSVIDLMLALTEDSVHEVLWTHALLAEHRASAKHALTSLAARA
jgi:hypothetical protein